MKAALVQFSSATLLAAIVVVAVAVVVGLLPAGSQVLAMDPPLEPHMDCMKNPFAPHCRGISAKRSGLIKASPSSRFAAQQQSAEASKVNIIVLDALNRIDYEKAETRHRLSSLLPKERVEALMSAIYGVAGNCVPCEQTAEGSLEKSLLLGRKESPYYDFN